METYQVLCLLKKYSRDCSEEKALQGRADVLIQGSHWVKLSSQVVINKMLTELAIF
ncbi:hypothetical protein Q9292_11915 [Methylophilus sp. VKM B-3414]|nr:hypothetical protein [Methylophilus sp. VKM B-3414]